MKEKERERVAMFNSGPDPSVVRSGLTGKSRDIFVQDILFPCNRSFQFVDSRSL